MILVERNLWFDSCAAEMSLVLLLWLVFCSGLFLIAKKVRDRPAMLGELATGLAERLGARPRSIRAQPDVLGYIRGSSEGIMILAVGMWLFLLAVIVFWPMLYSYPETVRITAVGAQVEVLACAGFREVRTSYPAAEVDLRYKREERGSKPVVHHMLVLHRRATGEQLAGGVDFVPRFRFNFAALRQFAPEAVAELGRRAPERWRRGL